MIRPGSASPGRWNSASETGSLAIVAGGETLSTHLVAPSLSTWSGGEGSYHTWLFGHSSVPGLGHGGVFTNTVHSSVAW